MPEFAVLLAHGSGIDDLIVAALIVVAFILLSRRKRKRSSGGGTRRRSILSEPPGPSDPSACLYCGGAVAPADAHCSSCGYVITREER